MPMTDSLNSAFSLILLTATNVKQALPCPFCRYYAKALLVIGWKSSVHIYEVPIPIKALPLEDTDIEKPGIRYVASLCISESSIHSPVLAHIANQWHEYSFNEGLLHDMLLPHPRKYGPLGSLRDH